MTEPTPDDFSGTLLSARALSLNFDGGQICALDKVSLDIRAGEFVAITGPSGCGKSSLLNLIGALDTPSSGALYFRGQSYSHMRDSALFRRTHLGFVFQSFHLIPTLSALDNLLVPTLGVKTTGESVVARAHTLLEHMGLAHRSAHFPAQLSGGERQRVAIARALMNDPALILADEPTGSLDSVNAAQVLDLLAEIQKVRALTIIMVTHDANVSARADRVIKMRDGKIESAGDGST